MGQRLHILLGATRDIERVCGPVLEASSIYETAAWGSDSKRSYLNRVLKISTPLEAPSLLESLLEIERLAGRTRGQERYGDRLLDIDVLFFNDDVIDSPHFHVPHPRLHLRRFVLVPLCEVAPGHVHPLLKQTAAQLLTACTDPLEVAFYHSGRPGEPEPVPPTP